MQFDIRLLDEVIKSQVNTIKEQLEGKIMPDIDEFEAIRMLGTI